MTIHKKLAGKIQHNDGDCAEIQVVGRQGIDRDLLLDRFQVDRADTTDTSEEFLQRFPIGLWLDITSITEITPVLEQERGSRVEFLQ